MFTSSVTIVPGALIDGCSIVVIREARLLAPTSITRMPQHALSHTGSSQADDIPLLGCVAEVWVSSNNPVVVMRMFQDSSANTTVMYSMSHRMCYQDFQGLIYLMHRADLIRTGEQWPPVHQLHPQNPTRRLLSGTASLTPNLYSTVLSLAQLKFVSVTIPMMLFSWCFGGEV